MRGGVFTYLANEHVAIAFFDKQILLQALVVRRVARRVVNARVDNDNIMLTLGMQLLHKRRHVGLRVPDRVKGKIL